jgi:hypothetical protein
MSSRLLTTDLWPRLTRLVEESSKALVAVAYFGRGASRLLPLKAGSVLVVDLSEAAVRAGQTCPAEVMKLMRAGVEVHSCANLHAKVFVFPRRAVVGSNNASQHSETALVEAAVETTDPEAVGQAREFVTSLRGEHVDPDAARRLSKLYRPPQLPGGGKTKVPAHPPLWVVPLACMEWDKIDRRSNRLALPEAREKLGNSEHFKLDRFLWYGGGFRRPLQAGELVIQVYTTGQRIRLYPAARVLLVRDYKARGQSRRLVYLRLPKVAARPLKQVQERLGTAGAVLLKLNAPRLIQDRKAAHALLQLWPSLLNARAEE